MSLTVIILTCNEVRHIERCIASLGGMADRIVIVDSGSTDETVALAAAAGAEVLTHGWTNHAAQVNWSIDNANITTRWTMRLDADEIVLPELREALEHLDKHVSMGLTVNRRIHFLGRWMRWGGVYPVRTLRLWRTGFGRCEDRLMDEHIVVNGPVTHIDADIADINLNSVTWWTAKHNDYATLLAIEALRTPRQHNENPVGLAPNARIKRWISQHIYAGLPLGMRAISYFCYRYFLRLGMLDGWQGLAFHSLHAGWYRFLVDIKIIEMRQQHAMHGGDFAAFVADEYGRRI